MNISIEIIPNCVEKMIFLLPFKQTYICLLPWSTYIWSVDEYKRNDTYCTSRAHKIHTFITSDSSDG